MYNQLSYRRVLLSLVMSFHCNAALAAAITNLDDKPQSFEADGVTVTIAPKETWRIPGKATIRYHGLQARLDERDEYAIWNDNEFGPQRRNKGSLGTISN